MQSFALKHFDKAKHISAENVFRRNLFFLLENDISPNDLANFSS